MTDVTWYAGTRGCRDKRWIGGFYPDGMRSDAMLAYYAVHLPAVEIDTTFARLPRAEVLAGWADAVPSAFRFALQAPRLITHTRALADVGDALSQLARRLEHLDGKLGAVRFELPAHVPVDRARLAAFLTELPRDLPAAIEFHHASWFQDAVFEALARRGVALCVNAATGHTDFTRYATCDWLYLRVGANESSDAALLGHCRRAQVTGKERGFVFFDGGAASPALAARFLCLAADARSTARPPRRALPRASARGRARPPGAEVS